MSANTEQLIAALETDITTLSTANSALEILQLITNIRRIHSANNVYPSTDDLPTANAYFKGMTAYALANSSLVICNGDSWNSIFSNTAPSGAGGALPWTFPGSNYGYAQSGNARDRFSFASDGNATNVGTIIGYSGMASQSSADNGYSTGGGNNTIQKFPFASDTDASADTGANLQNSQKFASGQSSTDYGYSSGAYPGNTTLNKFSFASDTDATSGGNLYASINGHYNAGHSSSEYGYTSGGPSYTSSVRKFPFASDTGESNVLALTYGLYRLVGQSSADNGYASGGQSPGSNNWRDYIQKFPFASDTNATDVGNLTVARRETMSGQSSTDYGYTSGGGNPSNTNVIDKFPYASDGNATDVGDLSSTSNGNAGHQY